MASRCCHGEVGCLVWYARKLQQLVFTSELSVSEQLDTLELGVVVGFIASPSCASLRTVQILPTDGGSVVRDFLNQILRIIDPNGGILSCFSKPTTKEEPVIIDRPTPAGAAVVRRESTRTGVGSVAGESHASSSNVIGVRGAVADTNAATATPLKRRVDWIIGLDFGTTFSGFAFARASGNTDIVTHYNYPRKRAENPYCKTVTGLYYRKEEGSGKLKCSSWGYPARSDYMENRNQGDAASSNKYLTRFKLLLKRGLNDPALAASIPQPFTVMSIITDYLRCIGEYALEILWNHRLEQGDHGFSKDLVQWVVTVPSIWDENAKQQMKVCMVNAGLVGVGGIDAVNVVLEPEAASFHCLRELRNELDSFNTGDKILVADIGGGTTDIVVQEMIVNGGTFQVEELTESSGGLCGGTHVDDSFMTFLFQKIPCLEDYLKRFPSYKTWLLKECDQIKSAFGHEDMSEISNTKDIELTSKLAEEWEAYESSRGRTLKKSSEVVLTQQDLTTIFAPVMDNILSLIAAQLAQVPDVKVMFLVGGFAESPHLKRCIRKRFGNEVPHITSPVNPGNAVAQGAVWLGLHPDAVVSRIAKNTYGTSVIRGFEPNRDPVRLRGERDGRDFCTNRFDVFVRKGDRVKVNMSLTKNYSPIRRDQRLLEFDLWSSTEKEPRYADEASGATKEGAFEVTLPVALGHPLPRYDMTLNFGRGHIEVRAVGNVPGQAHSKKLPVNYYG